MFVEPRFVAEVEFREWTQGGQLRAPSYKGLRDDKAPELVVQEEGAGARAERGGPRAAPVQPRQGALSRRGFTKRDVIAYYARSRPSCCRTSRAGR